MLVQQLNKKYFYGFCGALIMVLTSFFLSCVTNSPEEMPGWEVPGSDYVVEDDKVEVTDQSPDHISRTLTDAGIKSYKQLYKFFMANNPKAKKRQVKRLARYYILECRIEGINSDCAFVQMCLETGFLRFGGLVTPDMHNYCGLGAMDQEHRGEVFPTEQMGVRAHVQHLHAYATTEDIELVNPCIDRRYKYVKPRGKATTITGLTKTWAMDPLYDQKLERLIVELEKY